MSVLDTTNRNSIHVILEHEKYYVQNIQFNFTNKALAMTKQVFNECFNELLNPIDSVSIRSKQNYTSSFPANSELNSQFMVSNRPTYRLQHYRTRIENSNYEPLYFEDNFTIRNDTIPTLDSIHDLCLTVYCENGDVFKDSIIGINLKSNL